MTTLRIWFGYPAAVHLDFAVLQTPIADLWLQCMLDRDKCVMDDPRRFYGFCDIDTESLRAKDMILQCVDIINAYDHIIEKPFTTVSDQDYLNYLHHVFEIRHGLLDQQNHDWWLQAPESVRGALSQLNIAVHRCESLRNNRPRFVCTWFGMPKQHRLDPVLQQQHGIVGAEFGAVYLNYAEIGKTVLDLARDNDQYIDDQAFKPFDHYSADFAVTFFQDTEEQKQAQINLVADYYHNHQSFFRKQDIMSSLDVRIAPLKFKVAQLVGPQQAGAIETVRQHQYVAHIEIL